MLFFPQKNIPSDSQNIKFILFEIWVLCQGMDAQFTLVLDFRSYGPFDQFGDGGIQFIEVIEVNARFIVNTINVHTSPTDARMATISRIHEKWIQLVVTEEQGHFFERKILRCRLI